MNIIRFAHIIDIMLLLISTLTMNNAMQTKQIAQLSVIQNFISNTHAIDTIKKAMDEIENNKLGYDDYAQRTGLIWSDALVTTADPAGIVEVYQTSKATQVQGKLTTQYPESVLSYPALQLILCCDILPRMFKAIRDWTNLPETVFAQIFFQRCSVSEPMGWHQDPGEDYDPQANYSLVLMLSEQDDPQYGWSGGEFKIRSGLPEDKSDETNVETIIPRYNQAILFNNQINSHATTEVIPNNAIAKRDIIVIPFNITTMPLKRISQQ